jgi:hypothetical protein
MAPHFSAEALATGFENATPESIQSFIAEKLPLDEIDFQDFKGDISRSSFVILDERSIKDGTCIVYHKWEHMAEGNEEEDWDEEKVVKEWLVWRVKFLTAWCIVAGLWSGTENMQMVFENKSDAHTDENGVFQLVYFENSKYDLPDLENPVPYGPGQIEEGSS